MTYTITEKSKDNLSEQEKIIKEQLESWITDVYKNTDLEQRLKEAFENSRSHTKSLSQT
ncbi:MAG: hypothetical protein ISR80_04890 [Nitrosopumilus sp.]|nr:hypothetical protein [Nitrosopumilus sp.]